MQKYRALVAGRWLLVALATSTSLLAQISIRSVQILGSKDNVEIEVEATDRFAPLTQVLTGPDRLVIDIPNATPGNRLRSQSVDRGEVKDLRIGLFQSHPPVTRLVLDLKTAQNYQVFPDGRKIIIKVIGSAPQIAAVDPRQPRIEDPDEPVRPGLVTTNYTTSAEPVHVDPPAPKSPVEVSFRNGLLSIHADKATLSEVLNQVQQRTGAQISGASGTEQEQVVVDIPPAPAAEVMSRLLYGSKFNFLILSAASNPNVLDRVILTPRIEGGSMPQPLAQMPDMPVNDEAQMEQPPPQPEPVEPVQPAQPMANNPPQRMPRADAVPQARPDIPPPPADDPQE
jgi:hypothetical protein